MTEFTEIKAMLVEHVKKNDEDHDRLFRKMAKTDEAIRGNGQPGLKRDLDAVKARVAATESVTDEIKHLARRFVYGTLALIATGMVAMLIKT